MTGEFACDVAIKCVTVTLSTSNQVLVPMWCCQMYFLRYLYLWFLLHLLHVFHMEVVYWVLHTSVWQLSSVVTCCGPDWSIGRKIICCDLNCRLSVSIQSEAKAVKPCQLFSSWLQMLDLCVWWWNSLGLVECVASESLKHCNKLKENKKNNRQMNLYLIGVLGVRFEKFEMCVDVSSAKVWFPF